jgi:hypothetical protein
MNLSKSGLGFSWGFKGFRIGRDSRGRIVRTLSIPGTGLYNRQTLSSGNPQGQSSGMGCGGCIGTLFTVFVVLAIVGNMVGSGNTSGLIVCLVVGIGIYVAWRFLRQSAGDSAVDHVLPNYETSEQQHGGNYLPKPNVDAVTAIPGQLDQATTIPVDERSHGPIIDPQFTCATGLVTIDILKEKTKELIELLEPLLKVELRKTRQSSMARDLVEQDIRAIIVRVGFTNGSVSPYAAHLYLEIFKYLHPRTHTGWTVDSTLSFFQLIIEKNRETYLGVLKKPYTLEVAERLDLVHGTGITKPTRDIFLIIAFFAAASDGKVSEAKAAEIGQMRAIFEATQ